MQSLRRMVQGVVHRMDSIADRDADPAALTGRAGHRRHGLPVVVDPRPERTPEEAQQALDEMRADQHRRMRGRWRAERAGD
jgi:hypothetical protein